MNVELDKKVTIKQGVWGYVSLKKGNHMPTINIDGVPKRKPKQIFTQAKVLVFKKVKITDQSNHKNGFLENHPSKLIKETVSDNEGFYQLELEAGDYSIFVDEKGKLYNNSFSMTDDSSELIHGYIKVNKGLIQEDIIISHQAYF